MTGARLAPNLVPGPEVARPAVVPTPAGPARRPSSTGISPALVQGIGLRIGVLGTRGKSTLAAMTVAALRRRGIAAQGNGPHAPAALASSAGQPAWRRHAAAFGFAAGDKAVVDDAAAQVKAAWPMQALVLANHARSPEGMRRLHREVCMPHYALVTNVRRDPGGLAVRPLGGEARRLVQSITPGAVVICGEPDPGVRALLRREAERAGLAFLDAAPRRATPAAELLSILEAFLLHRFGKGFEAEEEAHLRKDLEARFRWLPSSIPGVRWFEGGSLHDVDSAQIALNHLQGQRRLPVTFVVYLRSDRPGRTRAYQGFLAELLAAPDTRQVVLCGHRAAAVAERLDRWGSQVRVVPDDVSAVPRLVRRLQFDCQGGAIVTLANDDGPWPQELARHLARPSQGSAKRLDVAVAAPAAANSAASAPAATSASPALPASAVVPRRIVRPLVAAAPVPSAQLPFVPSPALPVAVPLAAAAAALPRAPAGLKQ